MSKYGSHFGRGMSKIYSAEKYYDALWWISKAGLTYDQLNDLVYSFGFPVSFDPDFKNGRYVFSRSMTPTTVYRVFLLTGYYGDFPPITYPKTDTMKWVSHIKGMDSLTDIKSAVDYACSMVDDISPGEAVEHAAMYRVVHFLTCIRHEIMAADLYLRQVSWNPQVSFINPFYYRKGFMRNWNMSNNILKAEIIQFIYDVFYLLISAYKVRTFWTRYRFYPESLSVEDVKRLGIFNYINTDCVMHKVCFMLGKMHESLDALEAVLKRRPFNEKEYKITEETLLDSLQQLFKKVLGLCAYIRSYRLAYEPPVSQKEIFDQEVKEIFNDWQRQIVESDKNCMDRILNVQDEFQEEFERSENIGTPNIFTRIKNFFFGEN